MSHTSPRPAGTAARLAPLAMSLIAAAVLAACAAGDGAKTYARDGKVYGVTSGAFRHRWWNYYERAVSYIEGGYYEDAAGDLRAAIDMRETDGRRARTYGMHFTDYFPHRELGIAYLGLGRPEDAVRELETSLSQEESAKAKYYLNRARAAALSARASSVGAPSIAIDTGRGLLTNGLSMLVAGTAAGEGYVNSIRINGEELFTELSSRSLGFKRLVRLSEGENVVTVEATDLLGRTATRKLTITADRIGPVIDLGTFDARRLVAGGDMTVSGVAFDPSGVVSISVNGVVSGASGASEASFSVPVSAGPGSSLTVSATDRAGNTTTAVVGPEPALSTGALPDGGVKARGVYASLDAGPASSSGPPVIKLKDLTENQDVFHETLYVEGQVSGENDITSLAVNGQSIISHNGRRLFFNYLTALEPGDNLLAFSAADSTGMNSAKTIHVNRLRQSARSLDARLSVSVLPFKAGAGGLLAEPAYDSLLNELASQGRFKMVERAMLDEVLQEQALSMEDIVDPATAARFGKVLAAECVLVGSFHETENSVEIYARLVDTETAQVLASHDVYGEDKSLMGISRLAEGLAIKLMNSFPLVEGLVIKVDGDRLIVDIGKDKGIHENALIVVFREGERLVHPVTGKDLGAPTTVLARARLSEVYDEMATAELVNMLGQSEIKPLDMAITK